MGRVLELALFFSVKKTGRGRFFFLMVGREDPLRERGKTVVFLSLRL